MHDRRVDGIVLASMYTRKVPVPEALSTARRFSSTRSRQRLSIPSVLPDEAEAGRAAAGYCSTPAHGRHLSGSAPGQTKQVPKDSLAAVQRLQGIKEAFRAAGVELAGAVACTDWEPENGYRQRGTPREGTPSALICFNDRLALGAYQALADAGLAVPADVSVVSFDDDALASWVRPQLTTVALPHYELGRAAIHVLLDLRTAGRGSLTASRRSTGSDAASRARIGADDSMSISPPDRPKRLGRRDCNLKQLLARH